MAVYVDHPRWLWRELYWCHLGADSLLELHDFAALVGKPRRAFQCRRLPHYDLTVVQRAVAIELGALAVSSRELVVVARRLRAELLRGGDPRRLRDTLFLGGGAPSEGASR